MGITTRANWAVTLAAQIGCFGIQGAEDGVRASKSSGETAEVAVGVHNYAGVPRATLQSAQQQAAEIFGRAGIDLKWVACPTSGTKSEEARGCGQVMDSGGVFLKILPARMAARLRFPHRNYGVAFPPYTAFVFYQCVDDLSESRHLQKSAILGLIMTHELGHVLLGEGSHSAVGVMRDVVDPDGFARAAKGMLLLFTTEQAHRMHATLRREVPAAK